MPHEQLTALLASLIPLIPLFHWRVDPLHIAWGSTTANTETYAPKYLQSAALNQEALDGLFGHARSVRCALGLRWLQEAVTLPSDTPLPGLEALEAIRTHFVDNVAAPSLVVWAIGFATLALLLLWDVASTSALDWGPNSNASRRSGDPVTNPRFVTPSDGCLETSLSYHPPERWHAASVSDKSGETPTLSSPTPSGDLVNFGATAGSASSQPVPPTLLSSYTPLSLPSGLTSTVVPSLVSPEAAQSTHLAGHDVPPNSTQAAGTKVDRDVPQYHARMLSSITEISEPGESDRSVSGTPRVQWFSSIHGRFASLDTHDLTLQMQARSEGTTPSSSPDVHVAFGSGWSLIGAPSEVHEPLQLNASPDMHEDIGPEGGLTCVSDHSLGVGIPALPVPPAFGGIAPLGLDREPASEADTQWHLDVSPGPRPSDDGVAVPALATSCTNADTYHESLMEPTWNTPPASSSDLLPLDTEETLVVAPICAALGATPARMTSPGPALANIATSDACEVVRAGASLPVPSAYPIRSSSSTVVPVSASPEPSVLLSAPTQPPVVATSPRPMVTHIRRTSRILVARTGIAGQQVALTDAGLACAVGLLDKPLPLDEDVRGERRRMERVTDTLLESHSADR
ncbi:hypothetical protein DICSQDRAFT_127560 [Dichomitus squalens LYAD-421 SS1]|uniref:Uncharacterized protein n=1 Tax=Dichomitus squalens (strain LYAD-421) TaxID=732165 RepID=R7SXC8_DICSQ|nr:uncharacterized protein DICSQDRAFT_127560 [Dichomitus squalens LYAD-421 SS1]EJF60731.1 hypothetical protein DICSQDRAFT_127560 [Dichomitus squalens LYAD-421 SS1]